VLKTSDIRGGMEKLVQRWKLSGELVNVQVALQWRIPTQPLPCESDREVTRKPSVLYLRVRGESEDQNEAVMGERQCVELAGQQRVRRAVGRVFSFAERELVIHSTATPIWKNLDVCS
jgi:hypothetical protein